MLIEKGADPCVKNRNGKSPFEVATAPAVYNFLIQSRGKSYFFYYFGILFYTYVENMGFLSMVSRDHYLPHLPNSLTMD